MIAALQALLQQLPRLLLVAAFGVAAYTLHALGVAAGRAQVQAQWDAQTIERTTADRDQLARAIERTAALGDQIATLQSDNRKGQADALRASQTLAADLRAGRISLSIPAAAAGSGGHVPGAAAGAVAGPGPARTELDPATGASLVAITSDGDAAIRDLNTCLGAYAAVRAQVNAARGQP